MIAGTSRGDSACDVVDYRERRKALNFCEVDHDCVEIEPEPCLSSYYANAATASQSLRAVERELGVRCGATDLDRCDRQWLGPPRCRRGRCVSGELDRGTRERCSSVRAQLFEFDRPGLVYTESGHKPPMEAPRFGLIRVDEPGVMTLEVDPGGCVPYQLHIDRPRYATRWSRSIPASSGPQTLTYDVEAAEYRLRVWGPELSCPVTVTVTLHRDDGSRVPARYHGLLYDMDCE